jgi:beta-lactamase regulating signal transducer with metallopeptidase domain
MSDVLLLFQRVGDYVLAWSWQMAVLFGFIWIAVKLERQHRPKLRHNLWVATLSFGLLVPWVPDWIAAQPLIRDFRQALVTPIEPTRTAVAHSRTALTVPSIVLARPAVYRKAHPAVVAESGKMISWTNFSRTLGLLWVIGVLVTAYRTAWEYRRLARVASCGAAADILRTPPVRFSQEIRTPMLYGCYRPVILLPGDVAAWSTPEERAAMIRHEIVHYSRKDHWVSALESLIRTLFFFHPVVRWTCRQIDIERELACDEEVLRQGVEQETYAETLIKVAEQAVGARVPSGVHFSDYASLDRRVNLLFRPPKHTSRATLLALPLALLAVPTFGLGFWQAPFEMLDPIALPVAANPPWHLPEEALLPTPSLLQITAATPHAQDSAGKPTISQGATPPRLNIASIKITEEWVMVSVTLGLPYTLLTFDEGLQGQGRKAMGRVEGHVTNLTGKVITPLDDSFEMNVPAADRNSASVLVWQRNLYLRPGRYRLFLLISGSTGGRMETIDTRLEVPRFSADRLTATSLTIADLLEPLPLGDHSAQFRIGNLRVRPILYAFSRDQDLNIFQLVYPAASGASSALPIAMETVITLGGREVKRVEEELQRFDTIPVTRKLPLADFTPGSYEIQTAYTDTATGERAVFTGQFQVE